MDYEAWRCKHDMKKFCPDEGCPVRLGCARDRGWLPGMETPREYRNLPPLENVVSTTRSQVLIENTMDAMEKSGLAQKFRDAKD